MTTIMEIAVLCSIIITEIECAEISAQFCQDMRFPVPGDRNLNSTLNFLFHRFDTTEDKCICQCH
jgi:hypothetical protein